MLLAACGHTVSHAASPAHLKRPTAVVLPTPTLAQQVRRAEGAGPGFLDYCPKHNGLGPAYYQLDYPGFRYTRGWCQTVAVRGPVNDVITFRGYWDARKIDGTHGVATFSYRVPRTAVPPATPQPVLIEQSGPLPW